MERYGLESALLYSNTIRAISHACYAIHVSTLHIRIPSFTADFRFATACGMQCKKMNHDMSRFMRRANANLDGEIQKLMSQVRVSMNFNNTRDSQQVSPDVHSAYTPFNTPCYAPCSSHLFKMLWTHQPYFLFFNFFLHIKWYAIGMIIKPLCSISNGKLCNTD